MVPLEPDQTEGYIQNIRTASIFYFHFLTDNSSLLSFFLSVSLFVLNRALILIKISFLFLGWKYVAVNNSVPTTNQTQ